MPAGGEPLGQLDVALQHHEVGVAPAQRLGGGCGHGDAGGVLADRGPQLRRQARGQARAAPDERDAHVERPIPTGRAGRPAGLARAGAGAAGGSPTGTPARAPSGLAPARAPAWARPGRGKAVGSGVRGAGGPAIGIGTRSPRCPVALVSDPAPNVEHVDMVNTEYAYYPRNLSRPDQLDGIMHKLHRPGHTKDSMSFAEQGVTPFDGKVVFGPVDPTDSITNFARLSSLLFATSANIPATLSLHCESWYIRSTPL